MNLIRETLIGLTICIMLFSTSCTAITTPPAEEKPTPFLPVQATPTRKPPDQVTLFLSENIPGDWQEAIRSIPDITLTDDRADADLLFIPSVGDKINSTIFSSSRVYAVAVPFFTVNDAISSDDLSALWKGSTSGSLYQTILVSEPTSAVLSEVWGKPGKNVSVTPSDELLGLAEESTGTLAIIPFEEISPRWKILTIDGLSPLDKPFKQDEYALTVQFQLKSVLADPAQTEEIAQEFADILPLSNRDESKMTVLVMTGTTAITRGLAYKVTINDTDYPIEAVKDWFLTADLRHVSNEIPFVVDCPEPDPYTSSLVFCASPEMIEVLEKIGVNVVELTGNHENDYGPENLVSTLQMYADRGWAVFAAGLDPESARSPVLIESNGNKIAFIGCNPVGPNSVWAKEDHPGVAECDFDYLTETIGDLKDQGYVVVTTFQHEELTKQDGAAAVLMYAEAISKDFQSVAEAGSDIVQGSQAHYPMGFEFVGDNLIHYGLGNFLFDQMWDPNRQEFIDRHIIYDGKYINTEILTAVLMDWSRPIPMTASERSQFLEEIFTASLKRKK